MDRPGYVDVDRLQAETSLEEAAAKCGITLDVKGTGTERDIETASSVPKHLINYNFPVDYEAYERIEHGLQKLIETGHLDSAMELAKKLMRAGSNQVEMSDEGLMADTIADCLRVVARAVNSAEISDEQRSLWMSAMENADRVGFIWEITLRKL